MKHVLPNKERGVVMILILVFLTMFAIMISAFLFMTSNMSDSAANALAQYEKGETAQERSSADIDNAIRTLVVGTNNESSPIGPFGILENLYGDLTTMEGVDYLAVQRFNLYAVYGTDDDDTEYPVINDGTLPNKAIVEIDLSRLADDYTARLLDSGSTISFGSLQWETDIPDYKTSLDICRSFNDLVSGTSTQIIKKELTYDDVTGDRLLQIEIAITESLKQFFTKQEYKITKKSVWPFNPSTESILTANLRLNPPPFSGTGAGGFDPDAFKDGQLPADGADKFFFPEEGKDPLPDPIRLPFAFWGNAAAPDLTPYLDLDGNPYFQTFLRYLKDGNFHVYQHDLSEEKVYPRYMGMRWFPGPGTSAVLHEPIRMNPGYTAVDQRNLFLSGEIHEKGNPPQQIPSFVRPETFVKLQSLLATADSDTWDQLPALLRKVTPRPLRIDHWNWTGSNRWGDSEEEEKLPNPFSKMPNYLTGPQMQPDQRKELVKDTTLTELGVLASPDTNGKKWDVDNDNDGFKDGIWIPSGLPIRIDENGKPYATMYSFTVLDLDGRVNVNTAGNWNQLPYPVGDYYTKLEYLASGSTNPDPNSPWYHFENLKSGIDWYDDADTELPNDEHPETSRGTGLGPAGIDLVAALKAMNFEKKEPEGKTAQDILAGRYFSTAYGLLNRDLQVPEQTTGLPLFDVLERDWGASNDASTPVITSRGQLSQPSAYYAEPNSVARTDPSQWISDDSDLHRRFYLYTDAVYRGNKNETVADPNLFIFPWRGKTRVFDYGVAASTSQYPKFYAWYPTFDFCDTALRSYDPLGNDILTYMPKYSENPYLVNPYGSTQKDATFTAEMLELLLRPFDYDRKNRPTNLLSALLGKENVHQAINEPDPDKISALRREITTVSSDIPVPAGAIPVGTAEVKDGVFGLRELIRRCVVLEFYKADRESTFNDEYVRQEKADFIGNRDVSKVPVDIEALFRAHIRKKIENKIVDSHGEDVDKITDQLFALLPRDIQEGRRLDLNALSHKACWIDSAYKDQGNGNYVKVLPTGSVNKTEQADFESYHLRGLAERMKFARGLYVLLMTLTYEDRNAETVAAFYDNDPDALLADKDTYKDYLEGCYNIPGLEDSDDEKANLPAELMANRLAQYCVNLVDFTDPDATMTPFFYDPNPFDGWWTYRDSSDKLDFVLYTNPDSDFYDALAPERINEGRTYVDEKGFYTEPFYSFLSTPDAPITTRRLDYINENFKKSKKNPVNPVNFVDDDPNDDDGQQDCFSQALVAWLYGQSCENAEIGNSDFGMRLVWGMERPDLLLTETLAFHDLGIADTRVDESQRATDDENKDEDFDQVRRPLGSAYLELYCTANPNVPQSPELYEFDKGRNLWKLLLSKMTPRQKADSPCSGQEFPIWRVAITASTDPRNREKEFKDENTTYERTIRKEKNSVVERLVGDNADPRTFSFRTRQFCDLTIDETGKKSPDEKLDDKWRGYDYTVANILGPCAEPSTNRTPNFKDEVEIDRIVWFGWPTTTSGSTFEQISDYPDAAHIFSRVKQTEGDNLKTEIFPNQYLVVAPAEERQIGSYFQSVAGHFGKPSPLKIVLTRLRESNRSDYILAGTYNGFDINTQDSNEHKFKFNLRGLNISEPLWIKSADPKNPYPDPYPKEIEQDKDEDGDLVTKTPVPGRQPLPDEIFELPVKGQEHDRYPIAADHLVGLGTVPGIRSAFVQRVADPNRPYHPFANPYISVDWNMMDLTVFNGEAVDAVFGPSPSLFYPADNNEVIGGTNSDDTGSFDSTDVKDLNQLILPKSCFLSNKGSLKFYEYDTQEGFFLSRAWLNPLQEGFLPKDLTPPDNHRRNPWARSIDKDALQKDDLAGLKKTTENENLQMYSKLSDLYSDLPLPEQYQGSVVHIFPRHTLGAYNDAENRVTSLDGQFDGADNADNLRRLYYGAPSRNGSDESFQPFEFLAWNDAPFSSPAELLLVPASAPGRFGIEFVRHKTNEEGNGFDFSLSLYGDGNEGNHGRKLGRSLGSEGKDKQNLFGWEIGGDSDKFLTGPYLNFHHTSGVKGESLNLSTLFDYVTIPSLYMGTQSFCGYDENGDPLYTPTLREPGKINLNTMKESGWKGILGNGDKVTEFAKFSETRKTPFEAGNSAALNIDPEVLAKTEKSEGEEEDGEESKAAAPGDVTLLRNGLLDRNRKNNNLLTATEELRKLAGLTTNRSNVFAVWLTVGYFEVEKARPGVNMPLYDPDGNQIPVTADGYLNLTQDYKYSEYYKVIYPDGYTYGKELGTDGVDSDGITRPRAFYLIDRSIPVDFRRGRSWNWKNVILLERKL